MSPPLPKVKLRVLSTLNSDGTRRWITPQLSRGRFWRRRRAVGYGLIALFVGLPFVLFRDSGLLFRPGDSFVLMLTGITIVLAVFLVTALFGRVWCGWGCPQTVYLEHVFRPIERLLGGKPGRTPSRRQKVAKWAIYGALAFALANVFLAYFVGVDRLSAWVLESPADHPAGFATVVGVSALMLFNFGYFREQTCIVACPYGRLQSVLLDKQSLIIGYDTRRTKDCVDCEACVRVCPTGIDIRKGLQMECIGCAQCADACDAVMDKLHRPLKLIGYTSQDEIAGKPRKVLRPRTVIYPALLAVALGILAFGVHEAAKTDITVERVSGPAFVELPDGKISSQVRVRIANDTDDDRIYVMRISGAADIGLGLALRGETRWTVAAHKSIEASLFVDVPRNEFDHGRRPIAIALDDDGGFERIVKATLMGPEGDR